MVYTIGIAGTDARTLLSASTISTATSDIHDTEVAGTVIRGTNGMRKVAEDMGWPVSFMYTEDNTVEGYAKAICEGLERGDIQCVVPMPEALLFEGLVDTVTGKGYGDSILGLSKEASFVEGDKIECKRLCDEAGVPVADEWREIDARSYEEVLEASLDMLHRHGGLVLKYPYSAAGRGARIILDAWEIRDVYDKLMTDYKKTYRKMFGSKRKWPLLVESRMSGVEISFTAVVDGKGNYQVLPTALDYPERYEGPASKDNPITGGMGSISPHPMETPELLRMAGESIIAPLVTALKKKGYLRPCILYPGCYVSFDADMNPRSIRVCEVNIRPGEPEFQAVCRRLRNLGHLYKAALEGTLDSVTPEVREEQISLSYALVTGPGGEEGRPGYPGSCVRGEAFEYDPEFFAKKKIMLVPSAMDYDGENLLSDGSRVAFMVANSSVRQGLKTDEVAWRLSQKMLNAYDAGKAFVKRNEDGKNRLELRRDIGMHYGLAARIFKKS